ncbi:uroporphyrinogen-III decarboxylase-like protein [Candidatus Bathyarchaeota archaeon]|nr:uroporphyrinogen-III decarboxylase-like protein [Candidatus Bathyarchaeota archaeon]
MNGSNFKRLETVLRLEGEPDRVPFFEIYMDKEVMEALSGEPLTKLDQTNMLQLNLYFKVVSKLYERLGYDYVPLRASPDFPRDNVKFAADTAATPHSKREWLDEQQGLIKNHEDIDKYAWPDPEKLTETRLDHVELQTKHLSKDMKVIPYTSGVFENVSRLIGTVPLLQKIYVDPKLVEETSMRVAATIMKYIDTVAEHEMVGAVIYNDDMGYTTGPMMSPNNFRKFFFPWQKRIVETVHKHGKPVVLHSCGKLDVLMEDLIETVKIDAKHSYQDEAYPVTKYKKAYGDRIALLGGIDVDKLSRMKTSPFRKYVKDVLQQCMPGGGYALGSGNTVTNYVKLNNYRIMLEIGKKYGQYHNN